jgi:hypothetical protein
MYQLDIRRQDVLEPEPIDGVRVPATNFHEPIATSRVREPPNLLGDSIDHLGVAKLIDESHDDSNP